jgi:hypothetical protein
MEYLFGTLPRQADRNPLAFTALPAAGGVAGLAPGPSGAAIRLTFPRRAGLFGPIYAYETSPDLSQWTPTANVTETVLSTATVGGVQIENVQADVTVSGSGNAFVRLRWLR